MDNVEEAKKILSCLDLTSLHEDDTEEAIKDFCKLADTLYGQPAAICVFPQFIKTVKECNRDMRVATVINFPGGENNVEILTHEIGSAIKIGADELDIVLPYKALLNGEISAVKEYLHCARKLCDHKTMKIIIESGEIKNIDLIRKATELCIESGADFVKTSTGKTPVSATLEAANVILETIKSSGKNVGFKASGGIKTFAEAQGYLRLAQSIMGNKWVTQKHFRIGASSLLNDLMRTINRGY